MNKHFQVISHLAQTGRLTEALKKCERLIKKKPKEADYLLLAASLYAHNQQYKQVKEYCLRATRLEPENINALYNLGVACLFLDEYETSIKHTLPLIKLDKNHAGAYSNLGLAYWHTGELEKAKEYALMAHNLDSNSETNHNNLGLIYKSLEQFDKAIIHFKKAIDLNPQLAEACYNCAITMLDLDNEQGNQFLDKALLINPTYPEANNYKGLQLLNNNKAKQSIQHFQKAITEKVDYVEAYCNLGNALMVEQQFKSAEQMFRKAIEYNANCANAYNNLGNALLDQDNYRQNYAEAEQYYLKAIKLAPELNDTYKNLAVCYQGKGSHEQALHYFKLYNERVSDDEVVIASMASVYERQGNYDKGLELIEPFIQNNSTRTEIILAYAKLARYFKQEKQAIHKLAKIDNDGITNKLRIEKYYALGKLTDTQDDIDKTFAYYKQANDFEEDVFDLLKEKNKFKNIRNYFTREKIQALPRSGNTSGLPIFIIGMPRSGTSLAEQILASHPDIFGAGELENLHTTIQKMANELEPKDNYPLCLDSITTTYSANIANDYIDTLQNMAPEANYIVDKMPHNFLSLGVINLLFPKAIVIQCRRSSIDTCLSIYFQPFNKDHSYSNSLKMLGQYYCLYADMMAHWKKTLDLNIIELEYEKVIANPEQQMRHLLDQCGIDWHPACLKFYENKRTVMTPSYDQVRRPIYTNSVAKWKKYEHHLGELIESLGEYAY